MTSATDRAALALALFDELLDLDPAARGARLNDLRVQDAALMGEVARMLAADAHASGVIDRGLPAIAGTLAQRAVASEDATGAEGRRVGPFTLRRLLGRGGMGEVWLAQRMEGDFRQNVALKLLKRGMDSEDMLRRFVQERRILAELSHPGIARFIDGGVADDGVPWYAMEYVEGMALTEYARDHRLGVRERVSMMADVAEAVAYAQTRLVVHRDLKPSNILVDAAGRVHLLDFGIAKLLQGEANARETATGVRPMSPAYAAPEQILNETISTATDVYALGVVLYELLTASLPHQRAGASLETLADNVRHETPERPSARLRQADATTTTTLGTNSGTLQRFVRTIAGELDTIVLTALRREPARRYASAAALADDLRRWIEGRPVAAQPDTATYRIRKFVTRHRFAVGSASAVLLALIAGFGTALWQASVAREQARRADAEATSSERIAGFALSMVREQYAHGRETAQPRTPQEMLIASIDSARTALKDDDRARATILLKLGELQAVVDSPARAESAVVEALQIERNTYGDADPETASAMIALATVRDQSDQLVEAESLLREALRVYANSSGHERYVVMTRSRLASILRRTGRVDEAVTELEAARVEAVVAYGPDHPNTIELTSNGAMLLDDLGRLAEAEAGFRSAIAAYERVSGPDYPRLANPLISLGTLLARTGRYAQGRASMRRALDIGRRQMSAADPQLAIMGMRYVELLRTIGETDAAEHELTRIDTTTLQDRPVHHSRLLRLRGQLLGDRGRYTEALAELDLAGNALRDADGDLADAKLALDLALADALIASDRWDEAEAVQHRARASVATQARPLASYSIELARIEARVAAHAGRFDEAVAIQKRAIEQLKTTTGADTIEVARMEFDLADALTGMPGHADEAAQRRASAKARLAALGVVPVWAR